MSVLKRGQIRLDLAKSIKWNTQNIKIWRKISVTADNQLIYNWKDLSLCLPYSVHLNEHSSQVFHFRPKCWEKPKMYSHQVLTFSRFQDIAVQSSQFSSYFSVAILPVLWQILPVLWQKINFWHVGLNLFEKQVIYNSDPLLCFDNNSAKILLESYKHAVTFWNFVCHIWRTEGRSKLKFGEINSSDRSKFFERKPSIKYLTWMPF